MTDRISEMPTVKPSDELPLLVEDDMITMNSVAPFTDDSGTEDDEPEEPVPAPSV